MKIEVSIGEAVDKYSILEIKSEKIKDPYKLVEIEKELDSLEECVDYIDQHYMFYTMLKEVNLRMWEDTELLSSINTEKQFYNTYCSLYYNNKKRFRLKRFFDILCNSNLKEQKSYGETCCMIVTSQEVLMKNIKRVYDLSVEYDYIFFDRELDLTLFSMPNIQKRESYVTISLDSIG